SVSSGATDESVVVNQATPNISTTQSATSVTIGDSISDTATLKGGYGDLSDGTVTFDLYSNSDNTGLLKEFANETATNNHHGTCTASSGSYPTAAGGPVYWVPTYNGDSNNKSVSSGATDESVVVNKASPTLYTAAYVTGDGNVNSTYLFDTA